MATNSSNTLRRKAEDEKADIEQADANIYNKSWKTWPNKAGFLGLEEHRGPVALQVRGIIPAWSAGSLYRTGPSVSSIEDASFSRSHDVSHWFDGFAQTHKFTIVAPVTPSEGTTILYSSRRQSDDYIENIRKNGGWRTSTTFAQKADPCVGIFAKAMSLFKPQEIVNNVVVLRNVPGLGSNAPQDAGNRTRTGNLYTTTDACTYQELHPDTLEPLGYANQSRLHPDLNGLLSCAHAEQDQETGDMFNFNLEFGRVATYRVFRVNASTGTTDILAKISEADIHPAYIHSFFLTENYVVLAIPSSHFAWGGLKIPWKRNLLEAMKPFDQSNLMRWLVIDRRHGKGVVARFSTPAGFFFHSVNAFEEQKEDAHGSKYTDICLDYLAYDNTDIMLSFYYDVMLDRNGATEQHWSQHQWSKSFNPRLVRQRYRMPPTTSTLNIATKTNDVAEEVFSIPGPHVGELPTINPRRAGKPYRYLYCVGNRGLSTISDSIVKTDLQTREAIFWYGPTGHSPGEAVFVPRPDASDEDDGVVLSMVLDGVAQKSYLLCLDAHTMEEIGRAEAEFAIPMGFHGVHAPVAG